MPHVVSTLEFAARAKDRTWQMMTRIYEQLARIINGRISFGDGTHLPIQTAGVTADRKYSDNIDCVWVEVTFTAANTDLTVNHNLDRNVSAYLVARKSNAVDVYDSPTMNVGNWIALNGKQQYILRATAVADAVLLFF